MKKLLFALPLLGFAITGFTQDFATGFKSSEVAPGIHMLEGADGFSGGNIGLLVGDDRIVLIDDGLEPLAPALLEAAGKLAGRSIDFVINTHVHGDHVGGNAALAETGATIVAHDNIRRRMLASEEGVKPGSLPVITFSDAVTFNVNGLDAQVFHVEHAHTDGDAVIHFRNANVIHTGDVMFNGIFPFIDLDNGGSVDGYIAGIHRILAIANHDTIIIPGHGPVAARADLEKAVNMLIDAKARVKALVDSGKSEQEILAANPLADYNNWSWSFITTERMTGTLIRALMSTSGQ